jgi:hypothetical protein
MTAVWVYGNARGAIANTLPNHVSAMGGDASTDRRQLHLVYANLSLVWDNAAYLAIWILERVGFLPEDSKTHPCRCAGRPVQWGCIAEFEARDLGEYRRQQRRVQ